MDPVEIAPNAMVETPGNAPIDPVQTAPTATTTTPSPPPGPKPAVQTVQTPMFVTVQDERRQPETIEVTPVLAEVLARAVEVNKLAKDAFALSFSSILVGMLASNSSDAALKYFQDYSKRVKRTEILAHRQLNENTFSSVAGSAVNLDVLNGPLKRSESAAQAMKTGQLIYEDARGVAGPLDVRHLLAAYAVLTDYHIADFDKFGIDRRAWTIELATTFASHDLDEEPFWNTLAANPDMYSMPVPPFEADICSERDLLWINPEVRALAALIASHKTPLPLSIGLFGKWGSGKSFYMRQLQRRIEEIVRSARVSQGNSAYFSEVVQIQFNAWQYNESNLWASLVDHILRNLRVLESDAETLVQTRKKCVVEKLGQIGAKKATVDRKALEMNQQIAAKEAQISKVKQRQAEKRNEIAKSLSLSTLKDAGRLSFELDPTLSKSVQDLMGKLHVPEFTNDARVVQSVLGQAKDEISGWSGLFAQLNEPERRKMRLALLAGASAIPLVVGGFLYWLRTHDALLTQATALAATCGAYIAGAGTWLKKQLEFVHGLRTQIEEGRRKVDALIEEKLAKAREEAAQEVAQHLAELEDLRSKQSTLNREQNELKKEQEQTSEQLEQLSPEFLLNEFITERNASKDYVKHLGLAAIIRRDFDRLSKLIEEGNKAWLAEQGKRAEHNGETADKGNPHEIHRIVLYIDDLDRCSEEVVVKVLQAVHLLLAFPAFVVVVGVDSRWLTSCLETKLWAGLSAPRRAGTPLDYLEKIFQIPIWLPPLSEAQKGNMIQSFFRPGRAIQDKGQAGGTDAPGQEPGEPGAGVVVQEQSNGEKQAPVQLNPPELDITERESAFAKGLLPLLSDSPRVLKRFANTYRLVRAALSPREQTGFCDGVENKFRICMFQLAVLVCNREFAAEYLEAIRNAVVTGTFLDWLKAPVTDVSRSRPEWAIINHMLSTNTALSTPLQMPLDQAAQWAERAVRYSFVSPAGQEVANPAADKLALDGSD